jgi:hypothetical protein
MDDNNRKNSNITFTIIITLTIISFLIVLVIGFLTVRYFTPGSNSNTNLLPRLTLDLYEDLDAFMQYDY